MCMYMSMCMCMYMYSSADYHRDRLAQWPISSGAALFYFYFILFPFFSKQSLFKHARRRRDSSFGLTYEQEVQAPQRLTLAVAWRPFTTTTKTWKETRKNDMPMLRITEAAHFFFDVFLL